MTNHSEGREAASRSDVGHSGPGPFGFMSRPQPSAPPSAPCLHTPSPRLTRPVLSHGADLNMCVCNPGHKLEAAGRGLTLSPNAACALAASSRRQAADLPKTGAWVLRTRRDTGPRMAVLSWHFSRPQVCLSTSPASSPPHSTQICPPSAPLLSASCSATLAFVWMGPGL